MLPPLCNASEFRRHLNVVSAGESERHGWTGLHLFINEPNKPWAGFANQKAHWSSRTVVHWFDEPRTTPPQSQQNNKFNMASYMQIHLYNEHVKCGLYISIDFWVKPSFWTNLSRAINYEIASSYSNFPLFLLRSSGYHKLFCPPSFCCHNNPLR